MCRKIHFSILILIFACLWSSPALSQRTVSSHLTSNDLARLQRVFVDALSSTGNDLQAIYYSSLNIEPTNAADKEAVCKNLRVLHAESKLNDFEKDFYLIGANKHLRCTEKLPEALLSSIYAAGKATLGTPQEIYYRVATHKLLGVQLDDATKSKNAKALQELLKKDDSLAGLGYAFNVAPELGSNAAFVAERLEDAIVQADEVDGKMMQFEGGLSITALVVNGAFRVTKEFNKPTPITAEQSVKLANYFLSRRSVQTAKGAHVLIEALKTLSSAGKDVAPICIQLIGNGQIQAESPNLSIQVVDLLGKALSPPPKAIFGKIQSQKGNSVLSEKVEFVSKSSDKTTFAADLTSLKPPRGGYVVKINADETFKQDLNFQILGRIKVNTLEIGVVDTDSSSIAKKQNVKYPTTLSEILQADSTQKLTLKTVLIDESLSKPISVHQCFVRLYNKESDQEIIFVAEQDTSKTYKFDIDIGAYSNQFGYKSGDYQVHLIVGDAGISNSFQWHVANVNLKFPQDVKVTKQQTVRSALPEIEHQFRVPENRPPRLVSDIFTGLCLTPLVLLFIFWAKLGINVSNFTFSPSAIGFHVGLGGILALFSLFWWKLNMFQTLRLLIPVAVVTFLSGNRLLRRLYAYRMSKVAAAAATATTS